MFMQFLSIKCRLERLITFKQCQVDNLYRSTYNNPESQVDNYNKKLCPLESPKKFLN